MRLAPPRRGAIIRYSYLWASERSAGRDEGRKDRPVLAVAISVRLERGETELLVLPITHTPPASEADAVSIPPTVKRDLGLDALPSWVVTTEANAFIWPGPDVRPVPGRSPATVIYGEVPQSLLVEAARSFLANRKRQRSDLVRRTP